MEISSEGMKESKDLDKKLNSGHYLQMILLYLFFIVFTFVPTSYSAIRFALLLGLLFFSVLMNKGGFKYDKRAGILLVLYICYSGFSAVLGLVNQGSIMALRTNVLYPFLFFVMFGSILSNVKIYKITKLLVICAFIVSMADLWVAFYSLKIFPISPSILYKIDLEYIFNGGYGTYYQYTSTHMVSHFFLAPFVTVLVINNLREKKINLKLVLVLLMELLCIYFSGRAALILAYFISFTLIILYSFRDRVIKILNYLRGFRQKHNYIFYVIIIILAIGLLEYLGKINISGIFEYVIHKIEGVYSGGNMIVDTRSSQRIEYLSSWLKSPLIGYGMGTGVPYIRNGVWIDDKAIELTYVSMLFQYGIIGFLLFLFVVHYTIKKIHTKIQNLEMMVNEGIPYLFGLIGILIGAEADPYLFTMGCIWMLYLPFTIAAMDNSNLIKIDIKLVENEDA